jgi:hypothetical protein
MHRPSPALAVSLVALVIAMSGTAYAATGGDFILGKSNTATSQTSLSNSKGTALNLSSTSTTPPLTVSNSVQVPKLNASQLDGKSSSAFLPATGTAVNSSELGGQLPSAFLSATGTAANSSELGGVPASGFIQGGGNVSDGRASLSGSAADLATASGSLVYAECFSGDNPVDELWLIDVSGSNELATWFNSATGQTTLTSSSPDVLLDGETGTALIVLQVDTGSNISTYTLTEDYNSSTNTCAFTGQVLNSNG